MKFKGIENNSTVKEIGALFRRLDSADWRINVKLMPSQERQYLGISQLPALARRRVLNPTAEARPAGFELKVSIESTRQWRVAPIKSCPIAAVARQGDAQALCFVFEQHGITHYLPQLELARVLFFPHAYLARLALIHQGLAQEFGIQWIQTEERASIDILPNCTLPLFVRREHALRRVLGWILLDADARRSFESIAVHQLQNGHDANGYRVWRFQFDPPLLEGVRLTCRGHFDQKEKAFFVYEVHGITNLTCHCPAQVDFLDPKYVTAQAGTGPVAPSASAPESEIEIDDEQVPDADRAEVRLDPKAVSLMFANPFQTTRIGKGKGARGHKGEGEKAKSPELGGLVVVSTDEASVQGVIPSADYAGLDDESDDAHLYAERFTLFDTMVRHLVSMPGCRHLHRMMYKLPAVKGHSKHLLADGNPRCIVCHVARKDSTAFVLLEVDTSDSAKALSTLLLTQHEPFATWEHLSEVQTQLIKGSLAWPTSFLDSVFEGRYRRISHPSVSSMTSETPGHGYGRHWARRVYANILAS